jgi:hypothetical protein
MGRYSESPVGKSVKGRSRRRSPVRRRRLVLPIYETPGALNLYEFAVATIELIKNNTGFASTRFLYDSLVRTEKFGPSFTKRGGMFLLWKKLRQLEKAGALEGVRAPNTTSVVWLLKNPEALSAYRSGA